MSSPIGTVILLEHQTGGTDTSKGIIEEKLGYAKILRLVCEPETIIPYSEFEERFLHLDGDFYVEIGKSPGLGTG